MPEVDGFQATQQIRQLEQSSGLRRVAIMALTVSVIGEGREKGVNQQRWMDVWVNYLDQKS